MSEACVASKSGVVVSVEEGTHREVLKMLDRRREIDPTMTIGDLYGYFVTHGVRGGVFEVDKQTEVLALQMLEVKRRNNPSATLNELYADIVAQGVRDFMGRQPAGTEAHRQQHFTCTH